MSLPREARMHRNTPPAAGRAVAFRIRLAFVRLGVLPFLLLLAVIVWTRLGRYFYAVGGNIKAARLSGIDTRLTLFLAYVLCGAMAAIAAILLTARLDTGEANIGATMPLESIAACVIAGVSLRGGIGRIENVVLGALFIGLVQNGMNLARIESYLQIVVIGALLILAVVALAGFLKAEGMGLNHIKPHGALYGMAARNEEIAHAVCDAADVFGVPVLGMKNTLHERIYTERGHAFIAEFYADLEYDDDGSLIITREHDPIDPGMAAERCLRAIEEGVTTSTNGVTVEVGSDCICVHSDTPNAVEVAQAVRQAIRPHLGEPA